MAPTPTPTDSLAYDKKSALSEEQQARAAAIHLARNALRKQSGFASVDPPDAIDLLAVAAWILTGEDPWLPAPAGQAITTTEGADQ